MRKRTIISVAFAAVVLAASVTMASFKPLVKLRRHYVVTNVAELAPVSLLASQYLAAECVNPNTKRAYEIALEYFVAYCAKRAGRSVSAVGYEDITRAVISDFYAARLLIEAPASAALRLRVAKAFCAWCAQRYQVPHHGLRVTENKDTDPEFKGLSERDRAALISVARKETRPLHRFIPLLLLYTGMRNDKAASLTIRQIDKNREWINKVSGKSTVLRDIPITDDLRHEITRYMQWREVMPSGPTYPLLTTRHGRGKINNKTIWSAVNAACTTANTDPNVRHPHALRHTFAYFTLQHLEESGVKPGRALIILRDLLGHRDITTTMVYLGNDKGEHYDLLKGMS
jgi:integrase